MSEQTGWLIEREGPLWLDEALKAYMFCEQTNAGKNPHPAGTNRHRAFELGSAALAQSAASTAGASKEPGLRERLVKLRNAMADNTVATDSVEAARQHFIERIDSILRNYPRESGKEPK